MAREAYISPQTFVVFKTIGVIPTVPSPATLRRYHADFLDTDLEIGEWCRNIMDGKLWYRNESEIVEIDDKLFGPGINAFHNHDDRYYTKDELLTASSIITDNFSLVEEAGILYLRCGTLVIFSYDSN